MWANGWVGVSASAPAKPGHRTLFVTASEWVACLPNANAASRLQTELVRLGCYPLLINDEVGYIPFEPEAANLFSRLVSSRCERARLIVAFLRIRVTRNYS